MTGGLTVPHAVAEIYRQTFRERKEFSSIKLQNQVRNITEDVPDTKLGPGSSIQASHEVDVEKDAECGNERYQRDLVRVISSNQRK